MSDEPKPNKTPLDLVLGAILPQGGSQGTPIERAASLVALATGTGLSRVVSDLAFGAEAKPEFPHLDLREHKTSVDVNFTEDGNGATIVGTITIRLVEKKAPANTFPQPSSN